MVKKNITRRDLSNNIYRSLGFSKNFSTVIVDDFFEILIKHLIKFNKVKISTFGTLDKNEITDNRLHDISSISDQTLDSRVSMMESRFGEMVEDAELFYAGLLFYLKGDLSQSEQFFRTYQNKF